MELALGTVQFGMAYGIAGRSAAVPEVEIRAILEAASAAGVRTLDTAAGYGDIEQRLAGLAAGLPLRIVSKIPAVAEGLNDRAAADWALAQAQRSRDRLGAAMTGLMFHRADDLAGERGIAVWAAVADWCRREGLALGASCYDPETCRRLAALPGFALAQLSGNALDQRLLDSFPTAAPSPAGPAHPPLAIQLRSAFLQGLLLMPEAEATRRLPCAEEPLARWHVACRAAGLTPLVAALSVVRNFAAVDSVVVGVDSAAQWHEIRQAWDAARPLDLPEVRCDDAAVIDPRRWVA
jgi:aryl-alcohol dehydrogenase-like predicted oxidoreductase